LKFHDVEQGGCNGVLLIQNITSGEAQTFQPDLILDGEVISLVQAPSNIFKYASLEQAKRLFLKPTPAFTFHAWQLRLQRKPIKKSL